MTFSKPEPPAPREAQELHFGKFRLCSDGTLFRLTTEIRLPPKELQLLRLLAGNAGWVVSAEQLRKSLWGEVYVSPDSLPRCVSSLRAHLGSPDCIQTVYKRGYRFALPLEPISPPRRLETVPASHAERPHPRQFALPRLAVLPLMVGDGIPLSLGLEIAETTILRLARMRNQTVALLARDSVFSLAASGATAHQVGSALDAHLALAGSITAIPTHLRVRVEMIRVSDAVQLWVEDFLVLRDGIADADVEAAKRIAVSVRNRCATYSFASEAAEPSLTTDRGPILRRA
jgi:DNA-binding winged helix-turn-helix (wHTH) protein